MINNRVGWFLAICVLGGSAANAQNPVKVFILAGQSNMQGHGWYEDHTPTNGIDEMGTLQKLIDDDPNGTYDYLQNGPGNWITRNDVGISTIISEADTKREGSLSVGYGVNTNRIGPEFGFGWQVGQEFSEDVLIIKTSWGGKSINTDFRPPSAVLKRGGEVGDYYKRMLVAVDDVLSRIDTFFPNNTGYEISGFGWHQGWNDRSNPVVNEYEENLVDFINDVRFDLRASDMPFVVANTGIEFNAQYGGGLTTGVPLTLANAQLGAANLSIDPADPTQIDTVDEVLYPQYVGNVKGVNTVPYWRQSGDSPTNQNFHWNQNGQSYFFIGDAMGQEMVTMSSYVQFAEAYLEVNQLTGEIKVINPSSNLADMDLEAISITSLRGALDTSNWTPITGNYDGSGDGSVDSGNWTIDAISNGELVESAVPGGSDGLVAIGNEVSLGVGVWIQNLEKDLFATYTATDGTVIDLNIRYTDDDSSTEFALAEDVIFADLASNSSPTETDRLINLADWLEFKQGILMDMSDLSAAEAYQLGDLDGDFDNDIDDFDLFRNAFEQQNPQPGAFAEMLASAAVPEPSSIVLFATACMALLLPKRRALLTVAAAAFFSCGTTYADLLVYEGFDYTPGQNIDSSLQGGLGFAGPWARTEQATDDTATVTDQFGDWDGEFNNPAYSGGSSTYIDGAAGDDRLRIQRPLALSAGDLAGDDNELWASFIIRQNGSNFGRQIGFVLGTDGLRDRSRRVSTNTNFGGSGDGDAIGVGGAINTSQITPVVFLNSNIDTRTTTGAKNISFSSPNLVVLKYTFADASNPDTVSAWGFAEGETISLAQFDQNAISASSVIDQDSLNILSFGTSQVGVEAFDEIRLGDTFEDILASVFTPPSLSIEVNRATGEAYLVGDASDPVNFNYYQITSTVDSLNPASWNSLADQDFDGNGPPNDTGNGWEEGGGVNPQGVAEGYLLGDSTIAASARVSIGSIYDTTLDSQQLEFRFRIDTGQSFEGEVTYINILHGDYNSDNVVDLADYTVWRNNLGASAGTLPNDRDGGAIGVAQYETWKANFGATLAPALASTSVPEPSSLILLGLAGFILCGLRKRI